MTTRDLSAAPAASSADAMSAARLRLASQGLPKGSVTGFELMESNRFGMTQFQERLSFQRGLEGELTRSIQSLASVQSARVHLALPNQNGFFREQQKPSASVLLTLHPGRTLDRAQVAGIVHLVASSVPEMNPKAVSVVDDQGSLLSNPPDGQNAPGADVQKLQYAQQLEQLYTRRILDMLEPLVGAGNVKAQVSADIDFSQANQDPSPSGLTFSWSCDGAGNAGHYCDRGADSLLFRAMASPVADGRLWQDFLRRVEENAPAAFLYTQPYMAGVNSRFREVIIRPVSPWGSLWRWPAPRS